MAMEHGKSAGTYGKSAGTMENQLVPMENQLVLMERYEISRCLVKSDRRSNLCMCIPKHFPTLLYICLVLRRTRQGGVPRVV